MQKSKIFIHHFIPNFENQNSKIMTEGSEPEAERRASGLFDQMVAERSGADYFRSVISMI
jgi:hypothetical protein